MNFTSPYVDLPQRLTVRQNLNIYSRPLRRRPAEGADRRARRATSTCDEFLDRPFGRLSAGQKTRVLLAKSLINEPELLLLDEPTASLDPDTADQLRGHLERYQARTSATVLLASHNMGEVERLAHHVLMLRRAGWSTRAAPHELLARYGRDDLEDVFLDIARDRRRPDCRPHDALPAAAPHPGDALPPCLPVLGSWPRLLDLVYWPTVQMVLWGFITLFLVGKSGWVANAAGVFLSAVLLWDTLFRGQLGVSLCFLEEMYARHLGHLFVSPLRPAELVAAMFLVSLIRVLIGVGGAALLRDVRSSTSRCRRPGLGDPALLRRADAVRLGHRPDHRRPGDPPRPGCGEPRLGRDLLHPALLGRLTTRSPPCRSRVRWIAYLLPSAPVFEGMRAVLIGTGSTAALFGRAVAVLLVWLAAAGLRLRCCSAARDGVGCCRGGRGE